MFWTIWLLRNFYSGDAHHANYWERCSNHHFRNCAPFLYHIYSVLKLFEIAVCIAHLGFYEVSTPMMRTTATMVNIVRIIISDVEQTLYITFTAFWNFSKLQCFLHILAFTKFLLRWCAPWWTLFKSSFPTLSTHCISHLQCLQNYRNYSLFYTLCLLRNLYSGDAHHANYGERFSNHHFRPCAPYLYHIYSVLRLFEIAVCFAHFGFYEVSTPMMRTMVTMVNVVQIIISDIDHTVFITFKVFWNFSKLQCFLHILAFTKFLLRWCAP